MSDPHNFLLKAQYNMCFADCKSYDLDILQQELYNRKGQK